MPGWSDADAHRFAAARRALARSPCIRPAAAAARARIHGEDIEYQPGALVDWGGQNIFFNGNLDDIPVDNPTRERWFNIDAGFARESTTVPAAFQKRGFPFRLDDVRTMPLTFTNLSIQRSFGLGAQRTIQVRVDAQNVFNRQQWVGPNVNPASTQFGQVTNVALNQMRFFTFGLRTTF